MAAPTHDYRALMQQAVVKIEAAHRRIAELEGREREPIAVIGMAGRFPGGADDVDAYWSMLMQGGDGIVPIPANRWDVDAYYDPDHAVAGKMYVRNGGFINGIEDFDPAFFKLSRREAAGLDPQQRLWLETSWHALENAGIQPASLYGSATGVFLGISGFDYAGLLAQVLEAKEIDAYLGTGASLNMPAGRLSYVLGLMGPCMAVDTACSSSLVAMHLACQSLRNRECDLAISGGVNVLLLPETYVAFCRGEMLAPDGHCKTFDAAADGFIRSEGCGVVVLKRLDQALADGDPIAAVIRGSAVNQDGASGGLTVPSGPSQQAVIRAALAAAGVAANDVDYIEAHGTGTPLGDPIEMGALRQTYGRDRHDPLWIGSVKANVGHLEAAAGIAGLVRVVRSLETGLIPPQRGYSVPNPKIDWSGWPARIATEVVPWPDRATRLAAISAFGLSGTNAHMIVEQAPKAKASGQKRALPPTAFNRQRCWPDDLVARRSRSRRAAPLSALIDGEVSSAGLAPGCAVFEVELSVSRPDYMGGHRIGRQVLAATSVLVEVMRQALRVNGMAAAGTFSAVRIHSPLVLGAAATPVQVVIRSADGGASIEVHSRAKGAVKWDCHVTSAWQPGGPGESVEPPLAAVRARATTSRDAAHIYERYREAGFAYSGAFRSLAACWVGDNLALGRVELAGDSTTGYVQHPVWLDAAMQLVGVALAERKVTDKLLPTGCDAIRDYLPLMGSVAWGVAELGDTNEANLYLYTEEGTLAGEVRRLHLRAFAIANPLADRPAVDLGGDGAGDSNLSAVVARVRHSPPTEQAAALVEIVRAELVRALRLSSDWRDIDASLYQHGLDSLLAVELRNRLRTVLGVDIPVVEFMDQGSVRTLVASVQAQWWSAGVASSGVAAAADPDDYEEGEL